MTNSSAVFTFVAKSNMAASPLQDSVPTLDAVGPAQYVALCVYVCMCPPPHPLTRVGRSGGVVRCPPVLGALSVYGCRCP